MVSVAERQRPNLLFVFADQMRGMDMGCAGNPDVLTPTMDRMAEQGTRLTHCYATTPVCGPNRAILQTGTFPTTNRVVGNDLPLPLGLPTLGVIAQENGYHTGYIGKWHLDGLPRSRFTPPGPRRHGFAFWAAYNCSHDYFHPRLYRDTPEVQEVAGYEPVVQTDLALQYLAAHRSEPFCLLLSWGPPHDPYDQVPAEYEARYDPRTITLRLNVQEHIENPLAAGKTCRQTLCRYYAAITALDDQLARLLDGLEALGLADNTVVVFTSDHGDMLWSHGWMKKQSPYEEAVQVPFLIRWPGQIPAGRERETLLGTVDILPTLAGLLGWSDADGLEGADLSAALRGEVGAPAPASLLLANYLSEDEATSQQMPVWRAVRSAQYTYVELPERTPWMLFDNAADPFQKVNLIAQPESDPVRRRHREMLSDWLEKTRDPFLPAPQFLEQVGLRQAWADREREIRLRQ
jgi:arylsulfatase A-like enzyme